MFPKVYLKSQYFRDRENIPVLSAYIAPDISRHFLLPGEVKHAAASHDKNPIIYLNMLTTAILFGIITKKSYFTALKELYRRYRAVFIQKSYKLVI